KPNKTSLTGRLRAWAQLLGLPTFDDLNKLAKADDDPEDVKRES
ncbi:MAG: glycosyltransferase family 2 protein, partial [Lacticaseibacillus paracasei]|nr:glycosyltransferase family 2 protein [Lacticaseibacillus paracasei]